ncbi:hypothetical protein B7463_g5408, partial [Scytalidium lignicola]
MIDFYTNFLGFKLIKRDGDYTYLGRDNIFIGAIENGSSESLKERESYLRPKKGVEIVLEVDDLQKERDIIVRKGWELEADIETQSWGLTDFRLVDPDGYYIRITTHSPNKDGLGFSV